MSLPAGRGRVLASDGSPPLTVIACGATWVVVEKPSGMSVHNDPGRDLCTVVGSAVKQGQLPAIDRRVVALHAVHRLDRDTSGIVLLAGTPETLAFFGAQFSEKRVGKRYLALVHGTPAFPTDGHPWAVWSWPLAPTAGGRRNPVGNGRRQDCTTRWRILDRSPHYTLIECDPESGRRHQIRRHARLAGHPVVGDRRYGSTRSVAFLARQCDFHRLGLHAHALTLRLPGDHACTRFASRGLPETMRRLLDIDRGVPDPMR